MNKDATVIVDYDAGNLRSVQRACAEVGINAQISRDPAELLAAPRVIFPGVGAAGAAMASLNSSGLDQAIREYLGTGKPMLGICLGLQISLDFSEENSQETLGLIAGQVKRFKFSNPAHKIPHMGWNQVTATQPHPVLAGLEPGDEFYFVHGYYPMPDNAAQVYATTDYERDFASAIGRNNYFATQFHPEKSGRVGLRLLAAFKEWDGTC